MSKIKIQDICNILKNDMSEKKLFFNEISSPEFLVPFYNAGILDFADEASYYVIQYLQRVYSDNTKELIIKIVNENIEKYDISEIERVSFYQIIKLIELFDIYAFNQINTLKLLKHNSSIDFILSIFKNNEIHKNKKIVEASINTILGYIVTGTYRKKSELKYEIYCLKELLSSDSTKYNFEMALKQDFVFNLLLKKYNEIYFKTHDETNSISDVYSIQTMDTEGIKNKLLNEYYLEDVSDLILYFLDINLDKSDFQVTVNIKKLLSQRIFILRKLGLHLIEKNIDKYEKILIDFLEKINKNNIVKVSYICLYELVNIFQKVSEKHLQIDASIQNYLEKIPKKEERLKYYLLHGLKNHQKFGEQFYELKKIYKFEKDKPGIYIQAGLGGWVKDISPIEENAFKKKSIQEQVEYLNSDIKYDNKLIKIDANTVEEINERGLVNLFIKILEENINVYLEDGNIYKLNKKPFIKALLSVISQQVEKIVNIDKAITVIDNIFNLILSDSEEFIELLYDIQDFNINISEKRYEDFPKVFKFVKLITQNDFEKDDYSNESHLSYVALNSVHGKNFRCYMSHLTKIKKINKTDMNFLDFLTSRKNEEKFYTFYYYLGMQYHYLKCKFKKLHLKEKIVGLNGLAKKYFLSGYLSYFNNIDTFTEIKDFLLQSFKCNDIEEKEVRTRFVKMLLNIKLQVKNNKLFYEFMQHFSEDDYEDTFNYLIYNDNLQHQKEEILDYWHTAIKLKNKTHTDSLLKIFNKYCSLGDIKNLKKELICIVQTGLPDNLIGNSGVQHFLEKMLEYIKDGGNIAVVYDILDAIIASMKDVKYIYKEFDIIKEILIEFKKQGKKSDSELIAQKIYDEPSIKFYSINLKEFLK